MFAKAPIARGRRVVTFRGKPRLIWDIPDDEWLYTLQVDYDSYLLPSKRSLARYINHSCEPNCVLSGRSVVAGRRIERGEELTFDYSTDVDWPGFQMACRCGSRGCRKVVRAYRFLPRKLKLRYGRNVADFILREYPTAGGP